MREAILLHTEELRSEEALTHGGETVLLRECALPRLRGADSRVPGRVNRYYRRLEDAEKHACHTWLLARAASQADAAHAAALPFSPLSARLTWETTLLSDTLWSLCWRWSIQRDGTVLFYRQQGEVWDLNTGLPCAVERFIPDKSRRRRLLRRLRRAAREQGCQRPGRHGRRLSFTVTGDTITFYWPPRNGAPGEPLHVSLPLSEISGGII